MLLAPDSIPHQSDSSSCGVHACMNAYSLVCGDSSIPYRSEDIDDIRHWIGHVLINASPEPRKNTTKALKLENTSVNCFSLNSSDVIKNLKTLDQSSVFENVRSLAEERQDQKQTEMIINLNTDNEAVDLDKHRSERITCQESIDNQGKLLTYQQMYIGIYS